MAGRLLVPWPPELVRVWWGAVEELEARSDPELLDGAERVRAARFRVEEARRRFIAGRVLLRTALAPLLGVPPAEVGLVVDGAGKPDLAPPLDHCGLHVNLSHSGPVAVAAAARHPVGVDVEVLRPVERVEGLADRVLAAAERSWLDGRPSAARARSFLRLWTFKEACVKALGTGLARSLSEIEVDPGEPPGLIRLGGDPGAADRHTLLAPDLTAGVVAAVVLAHPGGRCDVVRLP